MSSKEVIEILEAYKNNQDLPLWIYLIIFVLAILGAYIGAYMRRKGENLATHEDIETITRQVEGIKTDFVKNTEALKARLQVITQSTNDFLHEKRKAYLNFLDRSTYWFHLCIDFSLESLYTWDYQVVKDTKKRFAEARFQTTLANTKLLVYNDNSDYQQACGEFLKATLTIQHFIESFLDKVMIFEGKYSNKDSENSETLKRNTTEYFSKKSELFAEYREYIANNTREIFVLKNAIAAKTGQILKNLPERDSDNV